MIELKFQNHMGFYVIAPASLDTGRILEEFTLEKSAEINSYLLLIEEERLLTKRRVKLLAKLKSEFKDFVTEEMPEVFL